MDQLALREGVHRQVGGGVTFVCDGVEYVLPPLQLGDEDSDDYQRVEDYYRSKQKSGPQAVHDAMDDLNRFPELRKEIMDRLYDEIKEGPDIQQVSSTALGKWLNTFEGVSYSLYVQLDKRYEGMTLEKARRILKRVGLAEMIRLRDLSSPEAADQGQRAISNGTVDRDVVQVEEIVEDILDKMPRTTVVTPTPQLVPSDPVARAQPRSQPPVVNAGPARVPPQGGSSTAPVLSAKDKWDATYQRFKTQPHLLKKMIENAKATKGYDQGLLAEMLRSEPEVDRLLVT